MYVSEYEQKNLPGPRVCCVYAARARFFSNTSFRVTVANEHQCKGLLRQPYEKKSVLLNCLGKHSLRVYMKICSTSILDIKFLAAAVLDAGVIKG